MNPQQPLQQPQQQVSQGYPQAAQSQQVPPQPISAFPVDYLNTIAPPEPRKAPNVIGVILLIVGVLIVALIALITVLNIGREPDFKTQALSVQGQTLALQSVIKQQQAHITDSELRATSATMGSSLASINLDLTEIMRTKGIKDISKPQGKEAALEAELGTKLNDAYLLGTLDRTFASEMSYQLKLYKSQLRHLKVQASSKAVNEFYDKSLPSIDLAIKELSEFSGDK